MERQQLSIPDFKQWISYEWRPVHAAFDEDDDGRRLEVVNVDMICEWRLTDGKLAFTRIPYGSPEELSEIIAALCGSIKEFSAVMRRNFSGLKLRV